MSVSKGFYAYPSTQLDLLEDIRTCVATINNSEFVKISTWENYSVTGKVIINNILEAINNCDFFMCDLTYLNYNVLYELGYAIAKEKKIWITINNSHAHAVANYKRFSQLTTIGYADYENSQELVTKFFDESPYLHSNTIDLKSGGSNRDLERSIIYLKCYANTNVTSLVDSLLKKSSLPIKIDDPYEGAQPLGWYIDKISNAFGVIIHFHTFDSEIESKIDIGRKALVAGLAKGLGKNTLLLAHDPFKVPFDMHDDVKIHTSVDQCEKFIKPWLEPVLEEYQRMLGDHRDYKADQKAIIKLSNLIMGDYVAENEQQELMEYFLETAEYREALKAQQVLFVGRKGTGKTANLMKLKSQISSDKRKFVIPIQPQGHEIEGVLNIFSVLKNSSERGHFIENIWKFLIYTEIAKQYYEFVKDQPLHYQKTEDENKLEQFVMENETLINADFTLRLENIVSDLKGLKTTDSMGEHRVKISEFLHERMINNLRSLLGNVLKRKNEVKILIDNLDKGWNDGADLGNLSELLFGLLNVVHKITDEFQRNTYRHVPVNLSLVVFLRSDIFLRIMSHAPERDKIPTKYLNWSDPELLFQVIEKRVNYNKTGITSPEALWRDYFCEEVEGVPLKQYIQNLIIPRPRDIIFLFKEAVQIALNRNHKKVLEDDFKAAENTYSEYALQSLFPENGNRISNLESILYEFAGQNMIISQEELEKCIRHSSTDDVNKTIQILCELTFLAQEIQPNKFEYLSDNKPAQITNNLAKKLAERNQRSKRYKINPAFHAYLGIEKA